jgi:cGMP-dependent protein kinase
MCGFVPFGEDCDDPQEVYELIGSKVLSFPDFFDIAENKIAKKFIEQLLNRAPEARLGGSYASLKAHRWFEKLDWVGKYSHRTSFSTKV